MPSLFRFYVKKRGARRTGSRALGGLLLWLFFAVCFLSGLAFASLALTRYVIPEWRVNHTFRETRCEVLSTRIKQSPDGSQPMYRPDVLIRYHVGSQAHTIWTYDISGVFSPGQEEKESIVGRFVPGQSYPCWYDPLHPEVAVVVRGYTWASWLMLLLPVAFLAIGGGGLVYSFVTWGKSAERRAAAGPLAVSRELFESSGPASEYPSVPVGAGLTDSPGTILQFRLPQSADTTWSLLVTIGVALAVNAVVSIFVYMSIKGHLRGTPDWFLTIFTIPWLFVGAATALHALRQLLIQTAIGPTIVEISDHPLVPGQRYRVMLSQAGRLTVRHLRLLLVCQERATYQQGTNNRTDSRRVFQIEVIERSEFRIQPGVPFEVSDEFELPLRIMHSFKADYNEVGWTFVVEGNLAGWPDFERGFPVIVYPPHEPKAQA